MAAFRILRLDQPHKEEWVVETTHDDGQVDTSVAYRDRVEAKKAADGWTDLDEGWARV
jgi:hypothetical protein